MGRPRRARQWLREFAYLQERELACSSSRPRVSNDNPHSESLLKTTRHTPTYPGRFDSFVHAERWCTDCFAAYRAHHRHSCIAYLPLSTEHHDAAPAILAQRTVTMYAAQLRYPERFVLGTSRATVRKSSRHCATVSAESRGALLPASSHADNSTALTTASDRTARIVLRLIRC